MRAAPNVNSFAATTPQPRAVRADLHCIAPPTVERPRLPPLAELDERA